MHLGEFIKKYRENNNLSMDDFAEKSGLSKAYISMLEKNERTKTGKPIVPSLETYMAVARGINVNVNSLLKAIGDYEDIFISNRSLDEQNHYYHDEETRDIADAISKDSELKLLFSAARDASPEDLKTVHEMLKALKRKEQRDG